MWCVKSGGGLATAPEMVFIPGVAKIPYFRLPLTPCQCCGLISRFH